MDSKYQKVFEIIQDELEPFNFGNNEDLKGSTNLYYDLGMDSLDKLQLADHLEKYLDKNIPPEEIGKWDTVEDIVNYIVPLLKI